jgi:fatty-acyl-CoA synthase
MVIAGSACPEILFRRFDRFGVHVLQAWGLTETAPIATVSELHPHIPQSSEDRKYELRARQGITVPFIDIRASNDCGEVAWDGATPGELEVRGPFVTGSYFKRPEESTQWTQDGWLRTGDVATIDSAGSVKITDRTKDLIKSGGEWISSVDVENAIVAHAAVAEAAVVAVPHPKWQERPLALIVLKAGTTVSEEELRTMLLKSFAKWQLPDGYVFVDDLPHTATGKLRKSELRETYKDWAWQTQCADQPSSALAPG